MIHHINSLCQAFCFSPCKHTKNKDTVDLCAMSLSSNLLENTGVEGTKDEALILQIRGENKQNRINIGVLVQVKELICPTGLNSCSSCNVFIASFHCLPKH